MTFRKTETDFRSHDSRSSGLRQIWRETEISMLRKMSRDKTMTSEGKKNREYLLTDSSKITQINAEVV